MKQPINELLKEKLLVMPNPICNKREFKFYFNRIFEGRDAFINFLSFEDPKQKASEAIRIISRLAYNSNFPPAINLLDNLRNFENDLSNVDSRSIDHISRDHYIHLCYLYLLGIYVFFYNPTINQKLVSLFAQTRFSSSQNGASNGVKSFLSGWKYFVLYHDIAYPLEYFGKRKHEYSTSEDELYSKYVKELDSRKIHTSIINMFACRSMATILAIYFTLDTKSKKKFAQFQRYFKSYFQNNDIIVSTYNGKSIDTIQAKNIVLNLNNVVSLDKIIKGDDVKYMLSALSSKELIVILFNKNSTDFLGMYYGPEHWFIYSKSNASNKLIRRILLDPSIIFHDEFYFNNPDVYLEFFSPDAAERVESYFHSLGISGLSNAYCENLINTLNISSKFDTVSEFAQSCFESIYERLFRLQPYSTRDVICASNVEDIVLKAIIDAIKPEISNKIRDIYAPIKEVSPEYWVVGNCAKTINRIVPPTISALNEVFKKVSLKKEIDKISKNVTSRLFEKRNEINDVIDFYKKMNNLLVSKNSTTYNDVSIESVMSLIDCSDDELPILKEEVCDRFIKSLLPTISDVIEDYIESSVFSRISLKNLILSYECTYTLFDHGVSSLFVYNEHMRVYRNWIDSVISDNNSPSNNILKLCFRLPRFDISEKDIENKYIIEYEGLIPEIAFALLNHNLYPGEFNKQKVPRLINNINTNTFSYFCMICDAIQEWGRSPLVNVGRESLPKKIFDAATTTIKIKDGIIEVYIDRANIHMSNADIKHMEDNFQQYLQNSNSYIRFYIS